jgi:hypothetical protein
MATITNALGLAGGIRLAAAIQGEIHLILADNASLRGFTGIVNLNPINGSQSETVNEKWANFGASVPFASIADGTAVTSTTPTFSATTITVGRSALRYDLTSLAQLSGGDMSPQSIARAMLFSAEARLNAQIAGTFTAAATPVGSTGVRMSVSDFYDGMFALETANNTGPFGAVLHHIQYGHLRTSLRSESNNVIAFLPSTAEAMLVKTPGYAGTLGGFDIFKTDAVVTVGADKVGAMMSMGAVGWRGGSLADIVTNDGRLLEAGTFMVIESERVPNADLQEIVGNMYSGAGIRQQAQIVKVVSSAT